MTVLALLTQWSERESQCFTARSTRITHPAVSSSRTRYVRGAQEGAAQGEREAGPVGAVVGGAVGAVTGTIGGILGVDDRRHFHEYVARLARDGPGRIPALIHVAPRRVRRCCGRRQKRLLQGAPP